MEQAHLRLQKYMPALRHTQLGGPTWMSLKYCADEKAWAIPSWKGIFVLWILLDMAAHLL